MEQPHNPSSGFTHLVFLAERTKNNIEEQINIFRHRRQNAGTLATLLTVLLTFFLNQNMNLGLWHKLLVLLPALAVSIFTFLTFFTVLQEETIIYGLDSDVLAEGINKNYDDILLQEISANQKAFHANEDLLLATYLQYIRAVKLTGITVALVVLGSLAAKLLTPNPTPSLTCQQPVKIKLPPQKASTSSPTFDSTSSSASIKALPPPTKTTALPLKSEKK